MKNMKIKHCIVLGLFVSLTHSRAADIFIPDGSFENVNATVNPPLVLGKNTGSIGAWTASMQGLLSLGGQVKADTATALNGPTPADGKYELNINMPANVLAGASLSQTLTNSYLPNSTYSLSFSISQSTSLTLLSQMTVSLQAAGSTNVFAQLSGSTLAGFINGGSGFQTLTLPIYKTGNIMPTNKIAIAVTVAGAVNAGGNIYLDNFKLTVIPTQVQVNYVTTPDKSHFNLVGSGGAPNATYQVITSTNLMRFSTNWVSVYTNQFDGSGNYNATFTIDPNTPCRFFRIMMP